MKEDIRITIRSNNLDQAELNLFKKSFGIQKDSEAYKVAVSWVNSYIKNVSNSFFPANYDVILMKKSKNEEHKRKVY